MWKGISGNGFRKKENVFRLYKFKVSILLGFNEIKSIVRIRTMSFKTEHNQAHSNLTVN